MFFYFHCVKIWNPPWKWLPFTLDTRSFSKAQRHSFEMVTMALWKPRTIPHENLSRRLSCLVENWKIFLTEIVVAVTKHFRRLGTSATKSPYCCHHCILEALRLFPRQLAKMDIALSWTPDNNPYESQLTRTLSHFGNLDSTLRQHRTGHHVTEFRFALLFSLRSTS